MRRSSVFRVGHVLEEIQNRLLEHLVANGEHMIAVRNVERPRILHQPGKGLGGAREIVAGAESV